MPAPLYTVTVKSKKDVYEKRNFNNYYEALGYMRTFLDKNSEPSLTEISLSLPAIK